MLPKAEPTSSGQGQDRPIHHNLAKRATVRAWLDPKWLILGIIIKMAPNLLTVRDRQRIREGNRDYSG